MGSFLFRWYVAIYHILYLEQGGHDSDVPALRSAFMSYLTKAMATARCCNP